MNVNIETPSALRRKVTIELEPSEINRELDRVYNDLKRTVQLKGFRPGHAPRNLLERFFGDQVRGDVIQKLQKEYAEKALEENDLKPIVEPELITEESDLKKPQFRFTATFDLKPEIVVQDYQDLRVPRATIEVTEEQVDQAMERLRERHGTLNKITGRPVQSDDFVIVSFEGFENGQPLPTSKFNEGMVRASSQSLAHGLDEVIIGAEPDSEVRKTRSYPADYQEKELAGKTVEWRAKVTAIYERVLPELDDEFAKDQGVYDSLAALRAAMRQELERRAAEESDNRTRQGLIDLIIERNPIEVPESLVAREQRNLEGETTMALEAAGLPHDEAAARARQEPEELMKRAQKRARSALIVDAIADQENVEVDDDEVADRVGVLVRQSGARNRERAAEFYSREENRLALKQVMRREKTLDRLLARAQTENEPSADVAGDEPSASQ